MLIFMDDETAKLLKAGILEQIRELIRNEDEESRIEIARLQEVLNQIAIQER